MTCPSCGRANDAGAGRCAGCGALLPPADPSMSWADAATEAVPTALPRQTASGERLRPGTQLGTRYEILGMLGQGGMGAVYKAKDLELDRFVALKVIRPDLASHPGILERFKREILFASQVTHRHVLRIHDLGEAGNVKFISMQYVEGEDLHQLLARDGPMTLEKGLLLARRVCEALQAAHDAGVVHRDLKPQNILLDDQGNPYIADFGISRSLESSSGSSTMTETGTVIGTVDYMSPEQARGEEVDHRSDIYSLGVILYEVFTGSLPFKGGSSLSVMMKRLTQDAPTIRQAKPQVPLWLSSLVARAMQRDVEARYQSVGDLLRDLDRKRASSDWKRALRRRLPAAAGAILVAAGLVAGVGLWLGGPEGPPATVAARTSLAVLPFVNTTGDPADAWIRDGIPEMLRAQLQQARALRLVGAGRVQEILDVLKLEDAALSRPDAITRLARLTGAENLLTGSLVNLGGTYRLNATLVPAGGGAGTPFQLDGSGSDVLLAMADELTGLVLGELRLSPGWGDKHRSAAEITTSSVVALRSYSEGLVLARAGNDLDALPKLEEAVAKDPAFPAANALLAEVHDRLGHADKAVAAAARAAGGLGRVSDQEAARIRAVRARLSGDTGTAVKEYRRVCELAPNNADAFLDLAGVLEDAGDLTGAEEALSRVVALDEKHPGGHYALARVMARRGSADDALKHLNITLELHRESGNEQGRAAALNGLGGLHKMQSRPDEAVGFFQESLELRRKLGDSRGQAIALQNIALVESDMGRFDDAIRHAREALELSRSTGDKSGIASVQMGVGDIYQQAGRSAEALQAYQESLKLVAGLGDAILEARCSSSIGYLYSVMGRYAEAHFWQKKALENRRAIGDKAELLRALIDFGVLQQLIGRYDDAIQYDMEARDIARDIGEKSGMLVVAGNLSNIYEDQGDYGQALAVLAEALPVARGLEDAVQTAALLAFQGSVMVRVGNREGARESLAEAIRLARSSENRPILAEALMAEGDLLLEEGSAEAASARYAEALILARQAEDLWLSLKARRRTAEAAGSAGELEKILKEVEAAGLEPLRAPTHLALARRNAAAGRWSAAAAHAADAGKAAASLKQKDLLLQANHLTASILLKENKKKEEALRHFEAAIGQLEEMRGGLKGATLNGFLSRSATASFGRDALPALTGAGRSDAASRLRAVLTP